MFTEAPTAIAPARNARSTLRLASINGIQRAAAHEGFHAYVCWDRAHRLAAGGDDGMHADRIAVDESFPVEVDGRQGQRGRIQRVDAQVRRSAGGAPLCPQTGFSSPGCHCWCRSGTTAVRWVCW